MKAPLANKTPDLPEDGYTPVFWDFFNYGLRLPASAFVNSVLTTIGRAPDQMGPFAWETLTPFQVGYLSAGVTPNLNLFSEMFNVLYQGVLSYFQIRSGVENMLYSEKPGKVIPNRWHRYWFLTKDAFSDDVPSQFFVHYTALNPEETTAQFNKLVEAQLLELKRENALIPSKVNYKAIVTGKTLVNQILGQKKVVVPKKSKAKEHSPKVTDNSMCRVTSYLVVDIFKNCMLRLEVLGAISVHSPTLLYDQFAHYQLRATEAGYAMFLKLQKATTDAEELEHEKSFFGNLLRQMREERDSAIAERNSVVEKYNGIVTSHAASEGKLKAEMGALSSSLEASKDDLEGVKTSIQESVLEKEALALKLSEAEKSVGVGQDFSGIDAHFKKYVTVLGDEYVTELFEDLPDEEDEDDEDVGDSDQE
ncbi:hypothetical protein LIER_00623 [Lithospermum erythrorhizon]|uniref:Transposase (putative) gypsy type domain-containing protein n=1 Tax=Lithospermum erythrorhizon TaxID=34254 RepID=A0AAV3NMV1_LITER